MKLNNLTHQYIMLNHFYFLSLTFKSPFCLKSGKVMIIKRSKSCIAIFDYADYAFQVLRIALDSVSIASFATAIDVSVNWQSANVDLVLFYRNQ